ncbi:MAG: rRNA pseudouridine synthase [Blastocatellia bacterium]|nr:rRNA pseudouridine synthase [Blastocatellia bacterium]
MEERLQKIIANAGIVSRRKAEELIQVGEVTVNGKVITQLGSKADPNHDHIKVSGKLINPKIENLQKVYILLNKPKGYLSSLSDPENRPLVTELLPNSLPKVHPVGRLDFNTEGLLILTNDGDLTKIVTSASQHVPKVYEVKVKGTPTEQALNRLRAGIVIEDRKSAPVSLRRLETSDAGNSWFEVILYEGRNNQIRKMFDEIGHSVSKLRRTRIGHVTDDYLPIGKFRHLSPGEIKKFFSKAEQKAEQKIERKPERKPEQKELSDTVNVTDVVDVTDAVDVVDGVDVVDIADVADVADAADAVDVVDAADAVDVDAADVADAVDAVDVPKVVKVRSDHSKAPKLVKRGDDAYSKRRDIDLGRDDARPPRREEGFRPKRKDFDDRPPRRDFRPRSDEARPPRRDFDDKPRRDFDDRPPRRDFRPRGDDARPPRRDFDDKPRRDFDDRPPRRDFRPRGDDARPPRQEFKPRRRDEVEIENKDFKPARKERFSDEKRSFKPRRGFDKNKDRVNPVAKKAAKRFRD